MIKPHSFAAKYFSGLFLASIISAGVMIQQYAEFKDHYNYLQMINENMINENKSTRNGELENKILEAAITLSKSVLNTRFK